MTITFSVTLEEFSRAMKVVSIVPPQLQGEGSGFFFMVRQDTCDVYSRDNNKHEARSSFKIYDVEGEGAFIFPAEYASAILLQKGPFTFKATEVGNTFRVKYTFGDGRGSSDRVSFDPRVMSPFEQDIQTARTTVTPRSFPVKLLQFAFGVTRGFLPKPGATVEDFYKTVKMFGASDNPALAQGNGYMQASNTKEVCYFQCSGFVDKELSVPQQHLSMFEGFLARSTGNVDVYTLKNKTYVMNSDGDVFGWPKHEGDYRKFSMYSLTDDVVVKVNQADILKQLNWARGDLTKDKFKVRLHYSPTEGTIHFSSEEDVKANLTLPVTATPVNVSVTTDLSINVNVNHMLHMFEGTRSVETEFRIKILPGANGKSLYMLRTIDPFILTENGEVIAMLDNPPVNGYECVVTRFSPSID